MDIPFKLPYRIFAVDPATTKSGWAVLDLISTSPLKIKIVAHAQIDGDKLCRDRKEMMGIFSKQFCVLDTLEDEYERLIRLYNPDQCVSESAYGYSHMSALIALTLAINVLRRVSRRVLNRDLIDVPPTISKKSATGTGGADKDLMRLAYQTADYLDGKVEGNQITEHEIDSIWHGVGHIKRDITQEITQISAKDKKREKRERIELKRQKEKEKA